jgi:hypothetical protein
VPSAVPGNTSRQPADCNNGSDMHAEWNTAHLDCVYLFYVLIKIMYWHLGLTSLIPLSLECKNIFTRDFILLLFPCSALL